MTWDDGLIGTARDIAASNADRLRVMAGPGTGKSFAMKRRIARLIEEEDVEPSRILAVTFTRTAAADLKSELHSMEIPGCEEINAGTLHSFCFSLLMREEVFRFVERQPRGVVSFSKAGVSKYEMTPLIQDVKRLGEFGGARECTKRILAFEAAWARLQDQEPGYALGAVDRSFEHELMEWLRFHKAMLIGELIPLSLRYLRDNPTSDVFDMFDYIVVDEYQDLNKCEQELLDVLGDGKSLAVVGDVDQSIYSFRYAHPDGILDFSNRHETHDETLNACRRCGTQIVDVANSVILNNHDVGMEDRLLPLNPPEREGDIGIVQWNSLEEEAAGLAGYVEHLCANGYNAGDILILSPRRLIAKGIKEELAARAIEAHSFYNDKVLEPVEAQTAFCLLTLLANFEDRVALRFWLGIGSPSCNAGEYMRLKEYCEENDADPFEVLNQCLDDAGLISGIRRIVARYSELLEVLGEFRDLGVEELLNALFPDDEEWAESIRDLVVSKLDGVEDHQGLHKLLHTEITQPEMPPGGEFVRLMSLHKSKGLTSKVVILVGCIRGLMPFVDRRGTRGERAALLQEQRRLFYVALTRAKEKLVLSSVSQLDRSLAHQIGAVVSGGRGAGRTTACEFMQELGPNAPIAQRGGRWATNGYT